MPRRGPILRSMSSSADVLTEEGCDEFCLHPEQVRPVLGRLVNPAVASDVAATFAVLSDPTRARILHALSLARELCVCDIALLLGLSESATSHQLNLLRGQRTVARRRSGRVVFYRLADPHVRRMLRDAIRHVAEPDQRTEVAR